MSGRIDLGKYEGCEALSGVYLVRMRGGGGLIKIGYAQGDVIARLRNWIAGSPYDVVLLRVFSVKKPAMLERRLHRAFGDFCVGGEWFWPCPPLLQLARCENLSDWFGWLRETGREYFIVRGEHRSRPWERPLVEAGTLAGLVP